MMSPKKTYPRQVRSRYARGADFEREVKDYLIGAKETKKRRATPGRIRELLRELRIPAMHTPKIWGARSAGSRGLLDVIVMLTYREKQYAIGIQCKTSPHAKSEQERILSKAYRETGICTFYAYRDKGITFYPDVEETLRYILQMEAGINTTERPVVLPNELSIDGVEDRIFVAGVCTFLSRSPSPTPSRMDALFQTDERLRIRASLYRYVYDSFARTRDLRLYRPEDYGILESYLSSTDTSSLEHVRIPVVSTGYGSRLPSCAVDCVYRQDGAWNGAGKGLDDAETARLLYRLSGRTDKTVIMATTGVILVQADGNPSDYIL